MLSLVQLFRSKQHQPVETSNEDIQLELQIQRDIQDVFADLFEDDGDLEPTQEPTPPPLRSEGTVSKRKLKEAIDSLLPDNGPTSVEPDSTRKRSRFDPQPSTTTPSSPSTFRPFSADALKARLSTFTLPSFTSSAFSARDAAEKGWENKGRERLVCKECKSSWVVSDLKGLKPQTSEKLKARMRRELVEAHKSSCPWRIMATNTSGSASSATSLAAFVPPITSHLLNLASTLDPLLPSGLRISHPEIPPSDLASLTSLAPFSSSPTTIDISSSPPTSPAPSPAQPSFLTALLLVIFNWTLLSTSAPKTTVVQCSTCLRRVGLWTFASPPPTDGGAGKTFDLQGEHLRGCVYRDGEDGGAGRWQIVLQGLVKREDDAEGKRKKALQNPLSFVQDLLGPKVSSDELRKSTADLRRLRKAGTAVGQ